MLCMRSEKNKVSIMNTDGFLDRGAVQLSLSNWDGSPSQPGRAGATSLVGIKAPQPLSSWAFFRLLLVRNRNDFLKA